MIVAHHVSLPTEVIQQVASHLVHLSHVPQSEHKLTVRVRRYTVQLLHVGVVAQR